MSSYLSKTLTSKLRESKPIDEVVLKILRASEDVGLCQSMVDGHSDVASGGAFAAESCRRLMLGENLPDIRLYLELDEQLSIQDSNL